MILLVLQVNISLYGNFQDSTFKAGEQLKYIMHYGWIDGGVASLTLKIVEYKGKSVYYAKAIGETIGITDLIYNVHDIYESYFDIETGLPYFAIRNCEEGPRYKSYNEVSFDHDENTVESLKSGRHEVPDNILDMVSAFYFMRKNVFNTLNKDTVLQTTTYFLDKIYHLRIRFMGIETIDTRLGRFKCMKFCPVVESGRVFDTEEDVSIYISNDKNYLPIRIRLDLMVGSFKADLIEFSGIANEFEYN